MRTLKKIVIGVFLYWLIFVTVMIVIFCIKNAVPDTLIQYALGGGAIELLATSLIEIFKHKFDLSAGDGDAITDDDSSDRPEDVTDDPVTEVTKVTRETSSQNRSESTSAKTKSKRKSATSSSTKRKKTETEDKRQWILLKFLK